VRVTPFAQEFDFLNSAEPLKIISISSNSNQKKIPCKVKHPCYPLTSYSWLSCLCLHRLVSFLSSPPFHQTFDRIPLSLNNPPTFILRFLDGVTNGFVPLFTVVPSSIIYVGMIVDFNLVCSIRSGHESLCTFPCNNISAKYHGWEYVKRLRTIRLFHVKLFAAVHQLFSALRLRCNHQIE